MLYTPCLPEQHPDVYPPQLANCGTPCEIVAYASYYLQRLRQAVTLLGDFSCPAAAKLPRAGATWSIAGLAGSVQHVTAIRTEKRASSDMAMHSLAAGCPTQLSVERRGACTYSLACPGRTEAACLTSNYAHSGVSCCPASSAARRSVQAQGFREQAVLDFTPVDRQVYSCCLCRCPVSVCWLAPDASTSSLSEPCHGQRLTCCFVAASPDTTVQLCRGRHDQGPYLHGPPRHKHRRG